MSESVDSMESDQDEVEAKTYQSDTDFLENLDSFIIKFKDSVDSFVETFKSKPVQTRVKERNRSCSSARRGEPDSNTCRISLLSLTEPAYSE